jgi:transposase
MTKATTSTTIGLDIAGAQRFGPQGSTDGAAVCEAVKPYVKSQKNDANDAEAICEAVTRPNIHGVRRLSSKSEERQVKPLDQR